MLNLRHALTWFLNLKFSVRLHAQRIRESKTWHGMFTLRLDTTMVYIVAGNPPNFFHWHCQSWRKKEDSFTRMQICFCLWAKSFSVYNTIIPFLVRQMIWPYVCIQDHSLRRRKQNLGTKSWMRVCKEKKKNDFVSWNPDL